MNSFQMYFTLGLQHIADLQGYDHILFIISLCAVYAFKDWKNVLVLLTAFTLGHSLTLALATFNLVSISSAWVEFLIPITILITAVGNIIQKGTTISRNHHRIKYLVALFFGLIHGLGFSNYLKSLLLDEQKIFKPLLGFNIGIELGQVLISLVLFILYFLFLTIFKVSLKDWKLVLSGAALGVSLLLIFERIPF